MLCLFTGGIMSKSEELKKVLEFYVLSNRLKTTVLDKDINFSMANNIYGSMILALGMNSEFQETKDLSKVLRMLFFSGFREVNPSYSFKNLRNGQQYQKELDELFSLRTEEAKLTFKYRLMDSALTKLIESKKDVFSYEELKKEAKDIFSYFNDDISNYEEVFHFYYLNYSLKEKNRSGWDDSHWNVKTERIEKISDHVIGTVALALSLGMNYSMDLDKVQQMLTLHEIGETIIGDITPFDGVYSQIKMENEHKAMLSVLGKLSKKKEYMDLLYEFDEKKTKEGKFAFYCDKLEADLQAKLYQDLGLQRDLIDQKNNLVFHTLKTQEMVHNGADTAFDIWYLYDRNIYENDQDFPYFSSLLEMAKDNNLLQLDHVVSKKKISLTENEHQSLVDCISSVVGNFYRDKNIECVFFTPLLQSNYDDYGKIDIVALIGKTGKDSDYDQVKEDINVSLSHNNPTNISICVNFDLASRYFEAIFNPASIKKIQKIAQSKILFDKSGTTSGVKKVVKSYPLSASLDLVDYSPSLDEDVCLKIKKMDR